MENNMDTIRLLPNSQGSKNMHSLIDKLQEKVNQKYLWKNLNNPKIKL